jgi:hypothetical protein
MCVNLQTAALFIAVFYAVNDEDTLEGKVVLPNTAMA